MTSSSLTSPVTGIEDESYTLMDLQVETDYTVTVSATNECGDESPPSTITVRIDPDTIGKIILCTLPGQDLAIYNVDCIGHMLVDIRPAITLFVLCNDGRTKTEYSYIVFSSHSHPSMYMCNNSYFTHS